MDVDDPMVSKKHDSMRQEEERAHRATHTDDSDAVAISLNISKATTVPSKAWYGMYRVLSRDGADSRTMACFYLAVVQAKLLYGSETWVLSRQPPIISLLGRRLERFHARELCSHVIWLAHHHIHHLAVDSCGYQPLLSILRSARRH